MEVSPCVPHWRTTCWVRSPVETRSVDRLLLGSGRSSNHLLRSLIKVWEAVGVPQGFDSLVQLSSHITNLRGQLFIVFKDCSQRGLHTGQAPLDAFICRSTGTNTDLRNTSGESSVVGLKLIRQLAFLLIKKRKYRFGHFLHDQFLKVGLLFNKLNIFRPLAPRNFLAPAFHPRGIWSLRRRKWSRRSRKR